ncbi:MAG: GerMN domain-containing protein [Candidatus Gracilibacteria bacterium]|jgi:hypothetical protein
MKKIFASLIFLSLIVFSGCQSSGASQKPQATTQTQDVRTLQTQYLPGTSTQSTLTQTNSPVVKFPNPEILQISPLKLAKYYLVALEDNGKSGEKIGCNDSLIPVDQNVDPTDDPIKSALTGLFSVKGQFYGESGLYNALYQSTLKVDSVTVVTGKTTVKISGKYALGGLCDSPRFVEQIKATVQQFPVGLNAEILINGEPIEAILSEKG